MRTFPILALMLIVACTAQTPQFVPEAPKNIEQTPNLTTESQTKDQQPTTSYQEPQTTNQRQTVDVTIKNFAFNPSVVNIKVGDTVRWTNQDGVSHTATGKDFDTGNLRNGESKEITFSKAGSYDYICTPHPNMHGKVIVE